MSTRPIPEHGTRARYQRGCHCDACSQAHRAYCKGYRTRRAPYRGGVMLARVASRLVRELHAQGWSRRQISSTTGVSATVISDLINGRHDKISRSNDAKIRANAPRLLAKQAPERSVDALGTTRRLQALAVMGHPLYQVAKAVGVSVDNLQDIARGCERILPETAAAVARVYHEWIRTPGPSPVAAGIARKRGWHGPLAWDDIDDPNAIPDSGDADRSLNKREQAEVRRTEILHLASFRFTPDEISAKTGLTAGYISAQIKGERKPGWRKEKEAAA